MVKAKMVMGRLFVGLSVGEVKQVKMQQSTAAFAERGDDPSKPGRNHSSDGRGSHDRGELVGEGIGAGRARSSAFEICSK